MRKIFLAMLLLISSVVAMAQSTANYTFATNTTGSLALDANNNAIDMSTGTTQLVGADVDNSTSSVQTLPFTFILMGNAYTQFAASTNGLINLSSTSTAVPSTTYTVSSGTTTTPIISAFGGDLRTGTAGKVHFKTVGTAPNRTLVIEFLNMSLLLVNSPGSNDGTYQVRLYEGTGVVEFVYGAMARNAGTTAANSQQVGIGFSVNTTSNNLAYVLSATNASSTTASFTQQTYTTGAIANLNSSSDGTRRVYSYTPMAPNPPTAATIPITNIGTRTQTLNWIDASNDLGYQIFRSTDNINYTLVSTVATNVITSVQTGLTPATKYYWRIFSISEGSLSTALGGTGGYIANTAATVPISGSKNVPGDYANLTAAITDLFNNGVNGAVTINLASGYVSSSEPSFPVTINSIDGASSTNSITIRPSTSGLSLTSATASVPTIDLNGAKFVTIDGRVNGAGAMDLILASTDVNGNAVRFINDASNNTIRYVSIRSANTNTSSGTVLFSTSTTGTTGNDNNTIEYCDIRDGATTPSNAIYATGTTTTTALNNSGNNISNNNIYNFFNASASSYGIYILGGNTDWTINNNNLYQTAARTSTTGATHYGISISNTTSGNNFTVTNNSIGGGAASAGGTAWTYSGAFANRFIGINLTLATSTPSNVQGNTIANFNLTTTSGVSSSPGVFSGIYTLAGTINIGTVTGNTIGSGTGTGSITVTNSNTGSLSVGIAVGNGANINIGNNTIGSFNIVASTTTIGGNFYGIDVASYTSGSNLTINNNLIGSLTTANSINCSTALSGSTNSQVIVGIRVATSNPVCIFTNNTFANFNNASVASTSTNSVRGIQIASNAPVTITGNVIRNFTAATTSVGTTTSASLLGISITSTNATLSQSISNNQIYNFRNTNTTAGVSVIGIVANWTSTTTSLVCAANNIHSLSTTGLASSNIFGIYIGAGAGMYQNNMIRLGFDIAGVSQTIGQTYAGINEFLGTNTIVNNSVYIGGTGVASSSITYALLAQQTTNTRTFRNNILVNDRQNASGTAVNVAAQYAGTYPNAAGLTLSNNVYFARTAANTIRNNTNTYTIDAWKNFSNLDALSAAASDTTAISFINARGAGTDGNLHLTGTTIAEGAGVLIATNTTDFDGETRSALTPTDIGADAGNFTANDVFGPEIVYAAAPGITYGGGNVNIANVAINDSTGVLNTGSFQPRIYFNKNAGTYFSTPGTRYSGTDKSGLWSFTIDHALLGGVMATDVVRYYIIAQDNATTPNINSNPLLVIATNVNTITTVPSNTNSYTVSGGVSWVGNTSSEWNEGSNWSTGVVPTATDNITIATGSGNMPIVGGVTALGAIINISSANATLNVTGGSLSITSISNGGTINVNGGTLTTTATITNNANSSINISSGILNVGSTFTNNGNFVTNGGITNVTGASSTGLTNSATTGSFTISGGTVNIGLTDNTFCNRTFSNSGTFSISSGTLNVFGNILSAATSNFRQSGGAINIDGNAAGIAANSVASGVTHLQFLQPNSGISLTGGTLTIVDPHANSTAPNVIGFNNATVGLQTSTVNHTLNLGNGISNDAGGSMIGFNIDAWTSNAYLSFGNINVNGGSGTNRNVSSTYQLTAIGNITVNNNSTLSGSTSLIFGGNLTVNTGGTFSSGTSGLTAGIITSNTNSLLSIGASTLSQTISGISANSAFTSLSVSNSNVAGVTFASGINLSFSTNINIFSGRLNVDGITLNGTSAQLVTLTTETSSINLNNLTLNNTLGATLSGLGFVSLTGAYTKTAGTLAAAGRLVLKSTANGTARLNALTAGSITGNVVVERFIPALAGVNNTARKYRFFAAPIVSQSINAGLQQRIHITGATGTCGTQNANGLDITTTGNTSMFDYDATRTTKWGTGISNTLTTNLTAGTGYRVLVRGSRSRGCALLDGTPTVQDTVTLYTVGVLAQGDIAATLKGDGSGYTLIGNPYASPIDWNNSTWAALRTTNSIAGTYYTYHPASAAGIYTTYDGTNLVNGQTLTNGNIIASGQAFFVKKTTAGAATVSNFFQETYKSSTAQAGAFRTNGVNQIAALRVGMKLAADSSHLDEAIIAFATDTDITKAYNEEFDSKSISEGAQTIAAIKDATACAIQRRPSNYLADTVALKVSSSTNGNYNLHFSDYTDITADIFIRDKFTNTIQDVKTNNYYSFSTTSNPASQGVDRFEVIFRNASTLPVTFTSINAKNKGVDEVAVTWAIPSEQNVLQYEVERSSNGTSFTQRGIVASKGNSNSNVNYAFDDAQRLAGVSYYRVKAVAKSGEFKYSPVVTVKSGKDVFAINIYPNPVKEVATLVVQNGASSYSISVLTLDGKQVLSQPKVAAQSNIIMLNVSKLAAGIYMLQVVTNDGNSITQKLIKE